MPQYYVRLGTTVRYTKAPDAESACDRCFGDGMADRCVSVPLPKRPAYLSHAQKTEALRQLDQAWVAKIGTENVARVVAQIHPVRQEQLRRLNAIEAKYSTDAGATEAERQEANNIVQELTSPSTDDTLASVYADLFNRAEEVAKDIGWEEAAKILRQVADDCDAWAAHTD